MSWANYKDKVSRYFPFSNTEWKHFIIVVLVFALMFSFTEWGVERFDAKLGFRNFAIAIFIVGLTVFVHHAAQRLWGIRKGYRIENKVWWPGILIALLITFLTNGKVLLFFATAMQAHFLPTHRLGSFRYGPSIRQIGAAAFAGPIACVLIGFILYVLGPTAMATKFFTFSLLFAGYNMLPIPPLDGFLVFVGAKNSYGGTFTYTSTVAGFLGFFALYFLAALSFWWSFVLALIVGFFGWFVFQALVK
ncbi:MAG: hypothetical protein ACRD2L_00175 [Terriglobia bacterium]